MDIQYVEFAAELFFKMCREHPEICPHDYHWITKKITKMELKRLTIDVLYVEVK